MIKIRPRFIKTPFRTFRVSIHCNSAIDLQKWAPSGTPWSVTKDWVVFSDLHVCPRTTSTALQVLTTVRQHALARHAGVIFLGDFWHMKGALPVEPLNEVLKVFRDWDPPTLMLVGNHDQASQNGLVHALSPIAATCPNVHIFECPALFKNALWLPYRRNSEELVEALHTSLVGDDDSIHAVFAHADVAGASLNDVYQARDGLPTSVFPSHIPTYTGHYHKPHTVPGTRIRYVGSPYQVTRSESGQEKKLLVLNSAERWSITEELPLDIGPRFFNSMENDLPLRIGDRVRLTLDEEAIKRHKQEISNLQSEGIHVEIVSPPPKQSMPRINLAAELGPVVLFRKYAEMTQMGLEAMQAGLEILTTITGGGNAKDGASRSIEFLAVEVEGYFSFKNKCRYNLADKGLVIVTGEVDSPLDAGIESNGAGKTALVMAPLWAVSGSVDTRAELGALGRGLANADLVNEDSKAARVKLEGVVDSKPFIIERIAVKKGRGSALKFILNEKDVTGADMRLTQAMIDSVLGTDLLRKTVFYGQSDVTALLEAGDRALKDELGKLVDLTVWSQAKEASWRALSAARSHVAQANSELDLRKNYLFKFTCDLESARLNAENWESQQCVLIQEAQAKMASHQRHLQKLSCMLRRCHQKLEVEEVEECLHAQLEAARVAQGVARGSAFVSRQSLSKLESLGPVCDWCLQPIDTCNHASASLKLQEDIQRSESTAEEEAHRAATIQQKLKMLAQRNLVDSCLKEIENFRISNEEAMDISLPEPTSDNIQSLVQEAKNSMHTLSMLQQQQDAKFPMNPYLSEVDRLESLLKAEQEAIEATTASMENHQSSVFHYKCVDDAFKPTGIVNFVLEGVLSELQDATSQCLETLTSGITLELVPCRQSKTSGDATIEQIEKIVRVRVPKALEYRRRSIRQLSGGERRRVAIALALGFSELASRRGRLKSNLLVLDEVTQHLDLEGRYRVGMLLKGLEYKSILLVAQKGSFTGMDASMDTVYKDSDGYSTIIAC